MFSFPLFSGGRSGREMKFGSYLVECSLQLLISGGDGSFLNNEASMFALEKYRNWRNLGAGHFI